MIGLTAAGLSALLEPVQAANMDCNGAPLCGVLVIESGAGSGVYHQDLPGTHGLWPETGNYGTSQCIPPSGSTANPTTVYSCYENDGSGLVSFETHEWEKHGQCAGVVDEKDFFTQVCAMSLTPISIMTGVKQSGGDLNAMSSALSQAGYEVFSLDTDNQQVYLSACSGSDGHWKLVAQSQFAKECSSGPSPAPSPSRRRSPSPAPASQCLPNTHGPECKSDADCEGVIDCVRCAHSGYCTDVPLAFLA